MSRRLLVLMARWPATGRCKSRLANSVGAHRAAAIQQRLLAHALAVLQQVRHPSGCALRLALAGAGQGAGARWLAPLPGKQVQLVGQGSGGLGLRLQRQLALAFAQGYRQVVLIGSDLPALEATDLQAAFNALERVPLVLGPASDGGYWLLGLNRPAAPLFAGIAWGSDQVLQQTCQRAQALGLPLELLRQQGDLDRGSDLQPWR